MNASHDPVRAVCHEYGDAGLLVDLIGADYEQRWRTAQAMGRALREHRLPGFRDVVASYENVFVTFDPLLTDHATLRVEVESVLDHPVDEAVARRFRVPAVYGDHAGPDLEAVADLLELRADEVVELHSAGEWVVRFVGSPLGAPMMDGPRLPRSVPRLATPRARVEAGSLGVSGFQSIVYNAPSPGGWQLIGRTPAVMFELSHAPHVKYRPGDRLHFHPIPAGEWESWRRPLEESA